MLRLFPLLFFCILSFNASAAVSEKQELSDLPALVEQLPTTKLGSMSLLIEKISATSAPQVRGILEPLIEGDLYYLKSNKQVV